MSEITNFTPASPETGIVRTGAELKPNQFKCKSTDADVDIVETCSKNSNVDKFGLPKSLNHQSIKGRHVTAGVFIFFGNSTKQSNAII